jgi:hypothetical protein
VIITLFFEKNANCFADYWEKSQKIVNITSTPDWANFRPLGVGLLWPFLENYRSSAYIWATVSKVCTSCVLKLDKNGLGYNLGD